MNPPNGLRICSARKERDKPANTSYRIAMKTFILGCVFSLFAFGVSKSQGAITLSSVDRGWYNSLGTHVPTNENYLVGANAANVEYRNWFVFDLTGLGVIESATLRAELPGDGRITFESNQGTENWTLFDVTTNIATLVSGLNGLGTFTDLGQGTSYGTTTVTSGSEGTFIEVVLNASAIASMNLSSGLWGLGGAITSLDANPGSSDLIFGNTDLNDTVQLVVAVPEPSSTLLLSLALGGCFLQRKRTKTDRMPEDPSGTVTVTGEPPEPAFPWSTPIE